MQFHCSLKKFFFKHKFNFYFHCCSHSENMRKVESIDSIQSLLAELTLNQERNARLIDQIHDLVEQEFAAAPLERVFEEDILPLVRAVPAATLAPLFSGYNFCLGDHVEILNPNKKLRQLNKGEILGKTNGGDSGGFLRIQAGNSVILRKPWKLKNLSR